MALQWVYKNTYCDFKLLIANELNSDNSSIIELFQILEEFSGTQTIRVANIKEYRVAKKLSCILNNDRNIF